MHYSCSLFFLYHVSLLFLGCELCATNSADCPRRGEKVLPVGFYQKHAAPGQSPYLCWQKAYVSVRVFAKGSISWWKPETLHFDIGSACTCNNYLLFFLCVLFIFHVLLLLACQS